MQRNNFADCKSVTRTVNEFCNQSGSLCFDLTGGLQMFSVYDLFVMT